MIDELTFCTCGLEMLPIQSGSLFKFCPNCDRTQEGEARNGRDKTIRDGVFERRWAERMKESYS